MARYRESHYGNCPVCGRTDGYLNLSCNHWFVCHEHKMKWFAGSSLFPSWQFETETDWLNNAVLLGQYQDVEPVPARTIGDWKRLLSEKYKSKVLLNNDKETTATIETQDGAINLERLSEHIKAALYSSDPGALRQVAQECLTIAEAFAMTHKSEAALDCQ